MSNYSLNDLSSSLSLSQSFMQQNYAGGEVRVNKTSGSANMNKASSNSLSSRTVSDYLNGNFMNRKPLLSMVSYDKYLHSSLNSQLIGGAEIGHGYNTANDQVNPNLSVIDPNSTNYNPDGMQKLTGGAAFAELMRNSIVSRNLASELVSGAVDAINSSYIRSKNDGVMIAGSSHDRDTYTFTNIELVGGSPRPETGGIALQGAMTSAEIGWLSDRARTLKTYGIVEDDEVLVDGFDFDIPDSLRNLTQNFGVNNISKYTETVSEETVQLSGAQKAYLAPALIELLLYLGSDESEIRIRCRTGAGGSATSEEFGADVDNLADNSMVNDHVFGRAIDVVAVTRTNGEGGSTNLPNSGSSLGIYRSAFELLMDELNKIGLTHPYLLPDSICVHSGLRAELEIDDGAFEVSNASVRQRYPGLKYVDFISSDYATKYIHLSFGSGRCGVYSGPGVLAIGSNGQVSGLTVDLSSGTDSAIVFLDGQSLGLASSFTNAKFNTAFTGDMANQSLSSDEVFALLLNVMQPEAAALFCAIAVREGGLRPGAFNPDNWADNDLPLPSAASPYSYAEANPVYAPSGVSFPLIATAQSFYDVARTILDYPNPENRYDNSGGGHPSAAEVENWTAADSFDCSGLLFWSAYKVGIAINLGQRKVERVSNVQNIAGGGWDWSYTGHIVDLMDIFGTKFVDSSGATIVGTDIPLPDYDRVWSTPGAVLIRGPEDIPDKSGHAVIAKGDGTRTIIHAAGNNVGLIEQTLSEESMYNYWHCGLIPGTYTGSGPSNVGSGGGAGLTYSVSDVGLHGDWSVGMFQVNLLPSANGQTDFFLPSPSPGQVVTGWKIGLADWQSYGTTTAATAGVKMASLYKPYKTQDNHTAGVNALISEVDERAWVPLNQAYILYRVATGRQPSLVMAEDEKAGRDYEYIYEPWGDYQGGPTYGFISNVRFSAAVDIYERNTTGTRSDLADWTLAMFENAYRRNGDPSPAKEHAQDWVNGTIFKSTYNRQSGRFVDAGTEIDGEFNGVT